MLHVINQEYPNAAAGLLTTTNEAFDRVAMHAVRRELLEAQAEAARLPLHVVPLPWPCSNAQYESIMKNADRRIRRGRLHARGIRRSVSRGCAALPRGASRGIRARAAVSDLEDEADAPISPAT